ncbi:hypothetical protein IMZ08_14110 [Bacillus luteolus]|uniref:Uncharacterized protein n=1 Tax=Litchfieldia luteola TaxID=682179 RepID=A0ABR9QL37_9BACI|nr:hypothetical protein [Cytobacillus luteolus]MBP1940350.1 hypothetical protein [Cytobacillus luteolus]
MKKIFEQYQASISNGDGGSGFDPLNFAQDDMGIPGKIIEIDVTKNSPFYDTPVVTRFNELHIPIQETLTVIVKGVRNIPGISYQRYYNQFIKYVGNVGQELIESFFSFVHYKPISVTQLVQASLRNIELEQHGLINLGWRAWEGDLPTPLLGDCADDSNLDEKTIAFYNEAIKLSAISAFGKILSSRLRPDKFEGTALIEVQAYVGNEIPALTGSVVFTDLNRTDKPSDKGVLAYTRFRPDSIQMIMALLKLVMIFGINLLILLVWVLI